MVFLAFGPELNDRLKEPQAMRYFSSCEKWIGQREQTSKTLANVAVIAGIVIAVQQLWQSDRHSKVLLAVDAVKTTRCPEFLRAFARLERISDAVKDSKPLPNVLQKVYREDKYASNLNRMIDDLNIVLCAYNTCWDYYREGIADREVIMHCVYPDLREFSKVLQAISKVAPFQISRRDFDKFLATLVHEDWEAAKRDGVLVSKQKDE